MSGEKIVCEIAWLRDGDVRIYRFSSMKKAKKFEKGIEESGMGFYQIITGNRIYHYDVEETEETARDRFGLYWDYSDDECENCEKPLYEGEYNTVEGKRYCDDCLTPELAERM